jgi:hypothetical protein
MESLSSMSNNIRSKKQKYTTKELAEIEACFQTFNIFELYDKKSSEVEDTCKRFLGSDKLII